MDDDLEPLRRALMGRNLKKYQQPPVENVPNSRVTGDALRHVNAWMGYGDHITQGIPSTVAGLIPGNTIQRSKQASAAALDDFKKLYHRDLVGMAPRRLQDFKRVNDFVSGFAGPVNLDD